MKKYLLFITALILPCFSMGQEYNNKKQEEVSEIFQKVESEMKNHYAYLEKNGIFEDPIGRANHFFKVVKKLAPTLLIDTNSYKSELLNLLTKSSFKKNTLTKVDIIYILYNLPINDYVDILYPVLNLYRTNSIDYDIFSFFIFQDSNVSNNVAKNYKNNKLQIFYNKLLNDKEIITKAELQNNLFRLGVLDLKSGESWEGGRKSAKEIFELYPAILDTLKTEL